MPEDPTRHFALVTGASSGIGFALARVFAAHRHPLVLNARDPHKLEQAAQNIRQNFQVEVRTIPADLADPATPAEIARQTLGQGLIVETLVNNAAFANYGPFEETPLRQHLEMLDLNIRALTELTHRLAPPMLNRTHGYILNVASTAAFVPGPLMAPYFASKAYVLSLSEALAEEFYPRGVTVTCLCPGPTRSNFQARANMSRSRLMQGKFMEPDDVARAGYIGLMAADRVVVPGAFNKLTALLPRLLPRSLVTKIILGAQEPR